MSIKTEKELLRKMKEAKAACRRIGAGKPGYDAAMAEWTKAWLAYQSERRKA